MLATINQRPLTLLKKLCRFLLRLHGWKITNGLPEGLEKCVVIAGPHTSNWDFYYMRLSFYILDVPLRFTIKQSLMMPPLGWILRPMGAIPIKRDQNAVQAKRKSYVDLMAEIIKTHNPIALVITPEGTRSKNDQWKSGFYHLAKAADVPLTLGFLDYNKKEAGFGPVLYPSEDFDADMRKIMAFYKQISAKHPQNFSIDTRYN